MQQRLDLAFGLMNGPQAVPTEIVKQCKTMKDALRLEWQMRRIKGMTQSYCASVCGFHAPHLSLWLSDKEGAPDMPAKHLTAFHGVTGWTLTTQWLAMQAELTVMEEVQANVQAERNAA